MFSTNAMRTRIPLVRPLRPPNRLSPRTGRVAFVLHHHRQFVSHRTSRPQLPYLSQPALRPFHPTLFGPNPSLARVLSTETRTYVKEQVVLAAKWTGILWVFVTLAGIAYVGMQIETDERKNPTPDEWRFMTRWSLRTARVQHDLAEQRGFVDWATFAAAMRGCLERLEDLEHEGKGLVEQAGGEGLLIPDVGKAGFDISGKSWPWRSGYYEVLMGCAAAAERMDSMVLDRTRSMVFPKEVMIGPSNPDPRPTPSYMASAPLEENCERPYEPPETYYMRALTTKGFTTKQRLHAALAYGNWLEFKGLNDSAEEMYKWAIDIAKAAVPTDVDNIIDPQTSVLKPQAVNEATSNLLKAITSLAIHKARTGDVSAALPILLSVLRARRSAPVSPLSSQTGLSSKPEEASTDIGHAVSLMQRLFKVPEFPGPPPSGDVPFLRASEKPTCEESELMLYVGEILFATSPSSAEGLSWTRQAVAVAEANLQASSKGEPKSEDDANKCRSCLVTGVGNWEVMLRQLTEQQSGVASREGSRNAGWLEWRGWFGGDGGAKGKTLDELSVGVLDQELRQVERLRERIIREGIEAELLKAKGASASGIWLG